MKIIWMPVRMDARLEVAVRGEVLVLNGEEVDLSTVTARAPLLPGAGLPWALGEVHRRGKALEVTLLLPHGATAPHETRFPADLLVTQDGPVALPPHDAPADENGDP